MTDESVHQHFDHVAPDYDRWKEKAHYYHSAVKRTVAEVVGPGSRVLEVGCGTGDILHALQPADGLGIDLSEEMIKRAKRKYPGLRFAVHDLMGEPLDEQFDYVVAVDVAEHVSDLGLVMAAIGRMLSPGGTLVVTTANPLWSPVLHLAERLGLKMPEGEHEWRGHEDLVAAAATAGLQPRSFTRSLLVPKDIPVVARLNDAPWAKGLVKRYGIIQRLVLSTTVP